MPGRNNRTSNQRGRSNTRNGGRGRGSGRGNRSGNGRGRSTTAKPLLRFTPHNASSATAVPFDTVKSSAVTWIQKSFDESQDLAESLRDEEAKNLKGDEPTREVSTLKDDAERKFEQEGFDMKYQLILKEHMARVKRLNQGLVKAYAVLFQTYCSTTMQNRIEEHPDYHTKIIDDPIELLKAIRTLMHDPIRARYAYSSLAESMRKFVNIRQGQDEEPLEYSLRFKQIKDILKGHLGEDCLDNFVSATKEYRDADANTDETTKSALMKGAFEQWCVVVMLENSDRRRYGSMIDNLVS